MGFPHAVSRACPTSIVFAALEKSFPLFRRFEKKGLVDGGGKEWRHQVFQDQDPFSTSYPQLAVGVKGQVKQAF